MKAGHEFKKRKKRYLTLRLQLNILGMKCYWSNKSWLKRKRMKQSWGETNKCTERTEGQGESSYRHGIKLEWHIEEK